jgi:6-hydroxycyclohex-1-ene-1-carbonyl-CoA dehydrogenase
MDGKVTMQPFVQQYPLDQINEIFTAAHEHKLSARAILVP